MDRSITAVLVGTFTLRFSTGLTGGLLAYYLADLPKHGGEEVSAFAVAMIAVTFFAAELLLSPLFGVLSDRLGHHRVMQFGPVFGAVAVVITGLTTNLLAIGGTRFLEGASTAASVPSILGFIAAATAADEHLRGVVAARFEAATIAGLGVGLVAAGVLWAVIGPAAFFLNAVLYVGSLAIYRYGVKVPPDDAPRADAPRTDVHRYVKLITTSHVWILAPTWIAINASLGLWTTQSLFQLVRQRDPRFADQRLMGGFEPWQVSIGLALGLLIFFAGLVYWGNRFNRFRRTTIILYGIGGGALTVVAGVLLNHSADAHGILQLAEALALVFGLFVLAGATPAAARAAGGHLRGIPQGPRRDHGSVQRVPGRRPDRRGGHRWRGGDPAGHRRPVRRDTGAARRRAPAAVPVALVRAPLHARSGWPAPHRRAAVAAGLTGAGLHGISRRTSRLGRRAARPRSRTDGGGLSHDELCRQQRPVAAGLAREAVDQRAPGGCTDVAGRDTDGRERRVEMARERDVIEADHGDVVGHPAMGLAQGPKGAERDDVAGDEDRGQVIRPGQHVGHRRVAAGRVEGSFGHEVLVERETGRLQRVAIPRDAVGCGGVGERGVRDAADAAMAELEQVLDRVPGPRPVVDVHAGRRHRGQGALQDDGKAALQQRHELVVVHPRAGDDQAVHPLRQEQLAVAALLG